MLVLTRKLNESIVIGEGIEVKIVQIKGTGEHAVVRLGLTAPRDVPILRKEIFGEVAQENRSAAQAPQPTAIGNLAENLGPRRRPSGPETEG